MIVNFKDKSLKALYEKDDHSKVRSDLVRKIENILTRLDAAKELRDMNAPMLKLHELKGRRKGEWTVTVNANWRVTFKFEKSEAYDVTLEDYH